MICLSSMIFRPKTSLVTLSLCFAVLGGVGLAAGSDDPLQEAVEAIDRRDGIAAEMASRRALDRGASRADVAAYIGEAELLQGDFGDARQWLESGEFSADSYERGYYALARLEISEGDYQSAENAFGQILAKGTENALIWVDLGRMRYRQGDHLAALEAAQEAVEINPQEPRALEFLAQLVRDAQGLNASLPLFREALEHAPGDVGLLGQYAATLGDAGEHEAMLRAVRRLVDADGSDPKAYYLQSILAARAGENDLARRLLWKSDETYRHSAAGLMLTAILEYRSGNYALAVEEFDTLRRMYPMNETALLLYGRALLANGEGNEVVALLEARALSPSASPYLLMLVGRAHEQLGQRAQAAEFLDRAMRLGETSQPTAYIAFTQVTRLSAADNPADQLRFLLEKGEAAQARLLIDGLLEQFPGSADLHMLAGDVELLASDAPAALSHYRKVMQVRSNWPLIRRMVAAQHMQQDPGVTTQSLQLHLIGNPRAKEAAYMLAQAYRDAGSAQQAQELLNYANGL